MCSLGYCHAFLMSTAGVIGLELMMGEEKRPKHVQQ